MSLAHLVGGAAVVAIAMLDALWTTLWVEGHAGPLTGRLTSGVHRAFVRISGGQRRDGRRVNHQLLSLEGPAALVTSVLLWVLLLGAGWTIIYSASPSAVLDSQTRAPADLAARSYFVGYSMFTLGNGDFTPGGAGWQVLTVAVSGSGFVLVTLTVTYLLSIIEAVVRKRSFASQVFALGESGEAFVVNAWDGRGFPALELQLLSLVEQLNQVTAQHQAYPMLHYYHAVEEHHAAPAATVVLDDALTLLRCGVGVECRPAPAALRVAERAVQGYLDTMRSAFIAPASAPPGAPRLDRLRERGIPTATDEAYAAAVLELDERRRLLRGLLDAEARQWPPSRG